MIVVLHELSYTTHTATGYLSIWLSYGSALLCFLLLFLQPVQRPAAAAGEVSPSCIGLSQYITATAAANWWCPKTLEATWHTHTTAGVHMVLGLQPAEPIYQPTK